MPNLILELKEALKEREVVAYKKKFTSYYLLIIDELGYVSFDRDGSELLFNLFSNRTVKKLIIMTTNLTFEKWPDWFGDTIMTAATVDCLTNKACTIQMIGELYRIRQT